MTRHRTLRRLLVLPLAAVAAIGASSLIGCGSTPVVGATPIFSAKERFARIDRNIDLELRMINDDIDRVLLLRPVSTLTQWHVP